MINFDEEIRKFKPCLELSQAEDAIYNNDVKDITDVLEEMLQQLNSKQTK
ncbi:MAG: hypothetical protein K2K56_06000 [Lachnospiraceae bacterium]|nr:hypothetical protein [Lachnospiraceae bacterium]MDE6625904.1 hypothetical protein [Lachnospiraceae bacterium]